MIAAMVRVLPFRALYRLTRREATLTAGLVAGHSSGVHRAVAEGILVQVLLVVVLRVVEVASRGDLGGDPPIASPGERGLELIAYSLEQSPAAPVRWCRSPTGTACRRHCLAACPESGHGSRRRS